VLNLHVVVDTYTHNLKTIKVCKLWYVWICLVHDTCLWSL